MKNNQSKHWSYVLTGFVLALLLIVFWYFNQNYLGENRSPIVILFENPILTFGLIILGAFISAFLSGEYSIKTPVTYEPLIFAFFGGIIMGVGAVIAAMSVQSVVLFNLAGIFTLTAFMITKGWIYAVFMILGGFVGSKIFLYLTLKTSRTKKEFFIPKELMEKGTQRIIFYLSSGIFVLFVLAILLFSKFDVGERITFSIAMLLLIIFGVVVERGTVCMSSMLKEWFISRTSYVWRSVLFTIMCLALFYQIGLRLSLYNQIELEKYISNMGLLIIGSFIMGFGFIFADGCFIGSLWKMGQGNMINMLGILGMLIGMGVSQVITIIMKQPPASGGFMPTYLASIASPLFFLVLLWGVGITLFIVFKPKHYRY